MSDSPSYPPVARPAWRQLLGRERRAAWDRFSEQFEFRPSMDRSEWPAIKEPDPSITFEFSGVSDGPQLASGMAALNGEALRCFVWALPDVATMLVLDWQHPAWWFKPAVEAMTVEPDDPINGYPTVYPDGDYYAFMNPDMTEGVFGHPWERTVCVFGQRLVETLGRSLATWLPVLRTSGTAVQKPT